MKSIVIHAFVGIAIGSYVGLHFPDIYMKYVTPVLPTFKKT